MKIDSIDSIYFQHSPAFANIIRISVTPLPIQILMCLPIVIRKKLDHWIFYLADNSLSRLQECGVASDFRSNIGKNTTDDKATCHESKEVF